MLILSFLLLNFDFNYVIVVISVVLVWITAGVFLVRTKRKGKIFDSIKSLDLKISVWHLAILCMGGLAILIAAGKGYVKTDEVVLWGAKSYGIVSHGLSIGATYWGTLTTQYPLNIPLFIGAVKTAFSETLPQSKIIFPIFYLVFLFFIYDVFQKKLNKHISGILTMLLATSGLIFNHATIAFTNLPAAVYFALGVYFLTSSLTKQKISNHWLGSILLVFAAWTRPEVLPITWVTLGFLIGFQVIKERNLKDWKVWIPALLLAGFTLVWTVVKPLIYHEEPFSQKLISNGLKHLFSDGFRIADLTYIVKYFLKSIVDIKSFGFTGFLMAGSLIYLLIIMVVKKELKPMPISGILYISIILASYYFTTYQTNSSYDLSWWVTTGMIRMALPGYLLLWLSPGES